MFTKNPYIGLLRLYWRFVPNKKLAVLMGSFELIAILVNLTIPYFLAQIINTIQRGGPTTRHDVLINIICLVLVPFISVSFHGTARIWEHTLRFKTERAYKLYLFQAVTSFELSWHNDHHSGETIDKIEKAIGGLKEFAGAISMYLGTYVIMTGALIALILIRPMIAIILPIVGTIIFLVIWLFDLRIMELIKEKNKRDHKVSALFYDYLSNIKTIITLRFIEKTWDVMRSKIDDTYPPFRKRIVIDEWKWTIVTLVLALSIGLMIGLYTHNHIVLTGTVLIGSLTMIIQYMQQVSDMFYNVAWQYSASVQNYTNTLAVEDIISKYKSLPETLRLPPLKNRKTIAINELSFTYKDAHKRSHTLQNIDLTLHAGEKIAVVGESGSGKSTFLSLLRGLYDVDSVKVEIGNKKYNHLHVLSHNTSLIPQEPEIFEDSMRYNITVGLEVDNATVEKFSRMACFHEVALSLPHEYETSIKEKGVNLSGGQKQRLALARGLLVSHESDILLLDESTSSVDSINERKIYQNIFTAYPQKTIVAAIHKLHLLPMFETIYVFDEGKIIESGMFDDLVAQGGRFAHMRKEYQVDMKEENI